jgi:hypothetical protein
MSAAFATAEVSPSALASASASIEDRLVMLTSYLVDNYAPSQLNTDGGWNKLESSRHRK